MEYISLLLEHVLVARDFGMSVYADQTSSFLGGKVNAARLICSVSLHLDIPLLQV